MYLKFLLFFYFIFLFHIHGKTNMGAPINPGTHDATIITTHDFDILSENIYITIDSEFKKAHYRIVYKIKADTTGIQVPFLFLALDQRSPLKILWDSQLVNILQPSHAYNQYPDSILLPYFSLFDEKGNNELNGHMYLNWEIERSHGGIRLTETNYFKIDISEGIHTVIIEYDADAWEDETDIVRNYSFRYSLSPARLWKTFHQLEIYLDASEFKNEIEYNLDSKPETKGKNIFYWKFDNIPAEVLVFSNVPEVSKFKINVAKYGPTVLLALSFIIIFIIHIYINKFYRKNNYKPRFSWVAILLSFFFPLIPFMIFCVSLFIFDSWIGPEASGEHGYYFLIFLLYVPFMPVYLFSMLLMDRDARDESRLKNDFKKNNEK